MSKTFYAVDEDFAASTGSNVNSSPGRSRFDYPPNATTDLVITSKADDDSPNLFEVGESYEIAFSGMGGGTKISDAVIIRSDYKGPGEGAIVFEGADQNGDLVQVVWAPNFNLEQWYWDHFDAGASPEFYTTDQDAAATYQYVCFAAGTLIATPGGQVPVERLSPGAKVATLDDGAADVLWTGRRAGPGWGIAAPVVFEAGAIGNVRRLALSQQHRVLVTSPEADLRFGAGEVFVPAAALADGRRARIEARARVSYHHLLLPRHAVLRAEGAPCESLYPGDMAQAVFTDRDRLEVAKATRGAQAGRLARPALSMREGRHLAREAAAV